MEKLIIVGAGGLGRMTMESAMDEYECYFVDDSIVNDTIICGTKVIGKVDELKKFVNDYKNAIIAIGDNKLREKLTKSVLSLGYNIPIIVNKTAYISPFSKIGYGTIILSNASIQNGATIGNGVVITGNVEVHHDCTIDDYSLIYSNSTIRTYAKIGKKVKIGSNVSISNSVIINDEEVIENGEIR